MCDEARRISIRGQERLAAFRLMYEHPLTDHLAGDEKGKRLNVLLIGNMADDGVQENQAAYNEIFKAVFTCGQYPGCRLNITLVSADAVKLRENFYRTCDGGEERMAELKHFVEDKGYAYLDFGQAAGEGDAPDLLPAGRIRRNYGYVIIHTGNDGRDRRAAEEVKKLLPEAAVWVYGDFAGDPAGGEDLQNSDLFRIAGNINFSYEMEYNERSNERSSVEEFTNGFYLDYGEEDFISAGKKYNADSSIACAAHIPCKLKYCAEYAETHPEVQRAGRDPLPAGAVDTDDPLQILIRAVNTREELYHRLALLEHRRWNAYMLTRGYHFPSEEEQKGICRDGILQKDIHKLWHICLCDTGELDTGELDRISALYKQKASEHSPQGEELKKICERLAKLQLTELRDSIRRMVTNVGTDVSEQYEKLLSEAKSSVTEEEKETLQQINDRLLPVKERNKNRNFYNTDAELINMLPFCIWHGKDYRTVIAVTDGDAVEDVKVPTLLCASKVVYVARRGTFRDEETRKSYQSAIEDFYRGRGGNIKPEFDCPAADKDHPAADNTRALTDRLTEIIRDREKGEGQEKGKIKGLVLSCPENCSLTAAIAAAQAAERMNVPLLQYDRRKGLVTHSAEEFCTAIDNKHMSIQEFMALNKRRILDIRENPFSDRQAWILENAMENSKDWDKFVDALRKKENLQGGQMTAGGNKIYQESLNFPVEALDRCGVRAFVDNLIRFRVVRCLEGWENTEEGSRIRLEIFDTSVFNKLKSYTIGKFDPEAFPRRELVMELKKTFMQKIAPTLEERYLGREHLTFDTSDADTVKTCRGFLEDLAKAGLVKYREEKKGEIAFSFEDSRVRDFCMKEGNAYELLLYFRMRNTGLFRYVGLGVHSSLETYFDVAEEVLAVMEQDSKSEKFTEMNPEAKNLQEQESGARYGLAYLEEVTKKVSERMEAAEQHIDEREIDVVAMYKMTPVFVSCKARGKFKESYVNEINTVANQLDGIGILCVTETPKKAPRHDTAVSVLGPDIVNDEEKLKEALEKALERR